MEKYISPAKSDSIAEVQNQLNQFVSVASMSESLISSNLMRGIFNLSFKAPEDIDIAVYAKDENDIFIADKFDSSEPNEKTGIIMFSNKFPLIVNEINVKQNIQNPFKIDIKCISDRDSNNKLLFVANNISKLIFSAKYQ